MQKWISLAPLLLSLTAFPNLFSLAFFRSPSLRMTISQTLTPQVLEFVEPTTKVAVVLIGSMHYNPTSIETTTSIIDALGRNSMLGSVLVESCPIRWNQSTAMKYLDTTPKNIFYINNVGKRLSFAPTIYSEEKRATKKGYSDALRSVLYNEMLAAYEAASVYQAPVILGDQLINVTSNRCGEALKLTFQDLLQPGAGWQRFYNDIKSTVQEALPSGDGYLGSRDFFDARLLINSPVSLLRYPLAIVIRNPLSLVPLMFFYFYPLFTIFSSLDASDPQSLLPITQEALNQAFADSLLSSLSALPVALLEVTFLSRLFLVSILAERNTVLAQNILVECRRLAKEGNKTKPTVGPTNLFSQLQAFFSNKKSTAELLPVKRSTGLPAPGQSTNKKVVAVLGMAHCNGVKKILAESRI